MALKPGTKIEDIKIDRVFIGRAQLARERFGQRCRGHQGRKVAKSVQAIVVRVRSTSSWRPKSLASTKFHRRRIRVARVGMQHVPRHESRHPEAGRAMCEHLESQLRGPSGKGGRTHLVVPRWQRRQRSRGTSLTSAIGGISRMKPFKISLDSSRRSIAPMSIPTRSSRNNSSRPWCEAAGPRALFDWRLRPTARIIPLCPQSAAVQGPEVLVARANFAREAPASMRCGRCRIMAFAPSSRRHLRTSFQQLRQKWPDDDHPQARGVEAIFSGGREASRLQAVGGFSRAEVADDAGWSGTSISRRIPSASCSKASTMSR